MSDIDFVEGLIIKRPVKKDGSPLPDWIIAKGSIKISELKAWLDTCEGEWVNFDLKESKKGNWYCAVDNWTPTKDEEYEKGIAQAKSHLPPTPGGVPKPANMQGQAPDIDDEDIPFANPYKGQEYLV